MSDGAVLLSLLILGLAGFTHGVFGIGFAMIATPLLALYLDYTTSLLLAAIPLLGMSGWWLAYHRSAWRSEHIPLPLLVGIGTGSVLGVAVQLALPAQASMLLLAALLAMSVALPRVLRLWNTVNPDRVRRHGAAFATLAGLTESSLNVGAPFMVLFGALAQLNRVQQLLVLNVCFFLGKSIQIALMVASGATSQASPAVLSAAAVVSLLLFMAGNGLSGRFPEAAFRRALNGFLTLMVVALLARAALS